VAATRQRGQQFDQRGQRGLGGQVGTHVVPPMGPEIGLFPHIRPVV
jgi:hypothetical protein